jgi:uncharacterized delta-60 repeat protein
MTILQFAHSTALFHRLCFGLFFASGLLNPGLAQPGTLDLTFAPGGGADGGITCSALQADGSIILGGSFSTYNGSDRNGVVRVNSGGGAEASFQVGTGLVNNLMLRMHKAIVQPDGKVVLVGQFTSYDGSPRNGIVRLDPDGGLDAGFMPGPGPEVLTGYNFTAHLQPNGKILVAGSFSLYNGYSRNGLVRLGTQGEFDLGLEIGSGVNGWINALEYQPDDKILIAGQFFDYNGVPRDRIARLNNDGSLDLTFDPGTGGSNGRIDDMVLQPDGKIIIAGTFTTFNGVQHNRISRLNADGSVDMDFDPGAGAVGSNSAGIRSLSLQTDGKIIIGGSFTTYDGVPRKGLARLNANGSLDTSFDPGEGLDMGEVYTTLLQDNGKILIGGTFTAYDGVPMNFIARVNGGGGSCQAEYTVMQGMVSGEYNIPSDPLANEIWAIDHSSSSFPPVTHVWNFDDGNSSTEATPEHTYTSNGPFTVGLTITDATGCSSYFSETIAVDEDGMLGMVGGGSDRSGFILRVFGGQTTGIGTVPGPENALLWPNPVEDMLNIWLPRTTGGTIVYHVIDALGHEVAMGDRGRNPGSDQFEIPVGSLGAGSYLLRIRTNWTSETFRFMKQ